MTTPGRVPPRKGPRLSAKQHKALTKKQSGNIKKALGSIGRTMQVGSRYGPGGQDTEIVKMFQASLVAALGAAAEASAARDRTTPG